MLGIVVPVTLIGAFALSYAVLALDPRPLEPKREEGVGDWLMMAPAFAWMLLAPILLLCRSLGVRLAHD